MRIYFDVCCFNRPYDDQTQYRIKFETEAIVLILQNCGIIWSLITSRVVDLEILATLDEERKKKLKESVKIAEEKIEINTSIIERAKILHSSGFTEVDAMHLACAEEAKVDVFITTDDKLLKKSRKIELNVKVENPSFWLNSLGE